MVFIVFAFAVLLGFTGSVFFGLFVDAYTQKAIGVKVEVHQNK